MPTLPDKPQFSLAVLLVLLGIVPILIAAATGTFGAGLQHAVLRFGLKGVLVIVVCVAGGLVWAAVRWLRGVSDDDSVT